jgi:hypothetical protein
MTQEKSPEDEAFDAITQSQMKRETGARAAIKEYLQPLEDAMAEMQTNALVYGTGMMKISMDAHGNVNASAVHPEQLYMVRNDTLEEVAKEFDKMSAFGDTAASFAVFVRAMKR